MRAVLKYSARGFSAPLALQLLGVWLVIVGCKLWLLSLYSSPLPFLDQWEAEGEKLLRPWLAGRLGLGDLFVPFNQHRIVPTRLLTLALFAANAQQWDAQVEMLAGALLHAACAVVLGAVLVRLLGRSRAWPIFVALLLFFCLPFAWQNTLWGFQSQFYFLILFTLLTLWGLGLHAPGVAQWWIGLVAGALACLSMGSGGFVGLALGGWIGLQLLVTGAGGDGCRRRAPWLSLAAAGALVALGAALYTPPEVSTLTRLQVRSPGAFFVSFGWRLGWPSGWHPLFALPAFAPLAVLLWRRLRQIRAETTAVAPPSLLSSSLPATEDFLFPLGFWVVLQAAALAYARNQSAAPIVSRYMDLQALGVLVNFCCLLRLLSVAPRGRRQLIAGSITLLWVTMTLARLFAHVRRDLREELPALRQINQAQISAVRDFLATDRVAALGGKPVMGLPDDGIALMADLLRDPQMQDILPTGLGIRRQPVPPGPLSALARTLLQLWGNALGGGLFLWLAGALWEWRRDRQPAQPNRLPRARTATRSPRCHSELPVQG